LQHQANKVNPKQQKDKCFITKYLSMLKQNQTGKNHNALGQNRQGTAKEMYSHEILYTDDWIKSVPKLKTNFIST